MKKILLALLLSTTALAQVDSSQIKKKTDGGITGDATRAVYVGIYRGTTAPASPLAGQFWCDTTVSPCMLKVYNGSTWDGSPVSLTIPTQTDLSSLPDSPTDGQLFFNKSNRNLYVYDSTATAWYGFQTVLWTQGANATDVPSGTVITAPSGAPVAARAAGCGSGQTTGTYSYKYTYANSTGGETTPSPVSNTITYSVNTDCTNWTGITAGGTGTTTRRLYQSKVNAPGGPWYWSGAVADNSTTTAQTAVANATPLLYAPEVNFSGAMPANWTVTNDSAATTSGGCGTTATQTFRCKGSSVGANNTTSLTSDVYVRANRNLSSYVGGNFTVTARFLEVGNQEPPTYTTCQNYTSRYPFGFFGVRYGTAAVNPKLIYGLNSSSGSTCPFTGATGIWWSYFARTAISGAEAITTASNNGFPAITSIKTANPIWVRLLKRGTSLSFARSGDGINWAPLYTCSSANVTDAQCGLDVSAAPTLWNQWESAVHMMNMSGVSSATDFNWVIEWDSFSIQVD